MANAKPTCPLCRLSRLYLKKLIKDVGKYLLLLDKTMAEPESRLRRQEIASLSNSLEFSRDLAKRYGLPKPKPKRKHPR